MSERRAIIDVGSNTVRLVIYGGSLRAPVTLFNEKVTARLGRGVAENGRLADRATEAALAALGRYAAILKLSGVDEVQAVATAAVRDAANGPAFLESARGRGLPLRLLSGEEEAAASARGVIAAFPGASGTVADVGGGSLELTAFAGERIGRAISLPLGTLRLAALRGVHGDKFPRRLRKQLSEAKWREGKGRDLYLVGGSWRALARFAMEREGWPVDDPHGHAISADEARMLSRSLAHGRPQPGSLPGISPSRLASLPDAAALLGALVREVEPSRLVFSSWGLREGLLHQALPPAERAADPLLAGIAPFAEARGCKRAEAERAAQWIAEAAPAEDDARLVLPALMLAIALGEVEPNRRAAEALSWALGKRWIGVDARGRALFAATMLANSGRDPAPSELLRLAPREDLRRAAAWGQALRLARKLGGGIGPAVDGSRLLRHGGELVLALRGELAPLCTEAVDKPLRALAETLGLSPRIAVG